MPGAPSISEWEAIRADVQRLWKALGQSSSVNLNSAELKDEIRGIIQRYFRVARPQLVALGMPDDNLATVDGAFQELLRLTNGNNARKSYRRWTKIVRDEIPDVSGRIELLLGGAGGSPVGEAQRAPLEAQLITTMERMIPTAALSYRQALSDLDDPARMSFRGPAVELREALREILDHLAPDDAVKKSDGFKLEKDTVKPTIRQKVHYILKARGRSKAAMSAPEDTATMVERTIGDLARSVNTQSSLATHVASARRDVVQLKRYVEAVLSDILEL